MKSEVFDVLIVGSGHAGGMATKVLTEKGIRCLDAECRAGGGRKQRHGAEAGV